MTKMNLKFAWESIFSKYNSETYRAQVIGGWLILHLQTEASFSSTPNSLVFVPDPDHLWEITND